MFLAPKRKLQELDEALVELAGFPSASEPTQSFAPAKLANAELLRTSLG